MRVVQAQHSRAAAKEADPLALQAVAAQRQVARVQQQAQQVSKRHAGGVRAERNALRIARRAAHGVQRAQPQPDLALLATGQLLARGQAHAAAREAGGRGQRSNIPPTDAAVACRSRITTLVAWPRGAYLDNVTSPSPCMKLRRCSGAPSPHCGCGHLRLAGAAATRNAANERSAWWWQGRKTGRQVSEWLVGAGRAAAWRPQGSTALGNAPVSE